VRRRHFIVAALTGTATPLRAQAARTTLS